MKPILIIQAGNKIEALADFPGDFDDWIIHTSGLPADRFLIARVFQDSTLPSADRLQAAIITGSPAMVTDSCDWIDVTREWLRNAVASGLPVLGICFGHQLIASALGGEVNDNPNGVEVGTRMLGLTAAAASDPLLAGLSSIPVQTSHRQAVLRPPDEAVVLATTHMDRYSALRFAPHCWGVQFHPEFNRVVTRAYVEYYRETGQLQDQDPPMLLQQVSVTPAAASLLQRFTGLAKNAV